MKKFIILLMAIIAISVSAYAQVTSTAVQLPAETWYHEFSGVATDTSSVGHAWSKIIMPNKPERLFYDMRVKVTEVSATTSATIVLKGKKMDTDTWSTITTITYKGTGTDTTAVFAETSTAAFWRFYQVVITPSNGKLKTTFIKTAYKY